MKLLDFKHAEWPIERDIQRILQATGKPDQSPEECKVWARALISKTIKQQWEGEPLTPYQAQKVGHAFEKAMMRAGLPVAKKGLITPKKKQR